MSANAFPCPFCKEPVSPTEALCTSCGKAPVVLGRFRLTEFLGRGGMSVVYGAVREGDGTAVAVKLLKVGGEVDFKAYELFERCSKVLQGLRHLSLLAVYAHGKVVLQLLVFLQDRVPPVLRRDIKPSNVMFRSEDSWEPVLIDFDTVAVPGCQQLRSRICGHRGRGSRSGSRRLRPRHSRTREPPDLGSGLERSRWLRCHRRKGSR